MPLLVKQRINVYYLKCVLFVNAKGVKTMFKHDDDALAGLIVVLVVICAIVAIVVLIASVILIVAGVVGVCLGGGTAIYNYCSFFKENIIDSNKTPTTV